MVKYELFNISEIHYFISLILLVILKYFSLYMDLLLFIIMGYRGFVFNIFNAAILSLIIVSSEAKRKGYNYRNILVIFTFIISSAFLYILYKLSKLTEGQIVSTWLLAIFILLLISYIFLAFIRIYFNINTFINIFQKKYINKQLLITSFFILAIFLVITALPILFVNFLEILRVPDYTEYFLIPLLMIGLNIVAIRTSLYLARQGVGIERILFYLISISIITSLLFYFFSILILIGTCSLSSEIY